VLPPGVYGGAVFFYAEAFKYVDGQGNVVLPDLELTRKRVGPFLLWVPDLDVAGLPWDTSRAAVPRRWDSL